MTMILGQTLRELREAKGMTVEQLADLMNVVPRTIYKWEGSETLPPYDVLARLTQFLDCSLEIKGDELIVKTIDKTIKEAQLMGLTLIEEKEDVRFFEDKKGHRYYSLQEGPIEPVVKGATQYQEIDQLNGFSIKYELNGYEGFSVWDSWNRMVRDQFWSLKAVRQYIENVLTPTLDVRSEIETFMEDNAKEMAECHLDAWYSRYQAYDDLSDVSFDLNVNYDISSEYEFVQDELGLELTSDEETYVFQCFHQAVLDELKHKRWK